MDTRKYQLFKTEMCRNWQEMGECRYAKKCRFAHGQEELRCIQRHARYKTEICRTFHLTGTCLYGVRCTFVHDEVHVASSPTISSSSSSSLSGDSSPPNFFATTTTANNHQYNSNFMMPSSTSGSSPTLGDFSLKDDLLYSWGNMMFTPTIPAKKDYSLAASSIWSSLDRRYSSSSTSSSSSSLLSVPFII